jgi:hypothetical protein
MHDGSVPSLDAVIDLYNRGGIDRLSRAEEIHPLGLTADEKADLMAFLHTLNGASPFHFPRCRVDATALTWKAGACLRHPRHNDPLSRIQAHGRGGMRGAAGTSQA